MAKLTLTDLENLENQSSATALINANNTLIENALEITLSRDATSPNTMIAALDMNSNRILNLPAAVLDTEPVRLAEVGNAAAYATAAAASETAAAVSQNAAAASATSSTTSATAAATSATASASSATASAASAVIAQAAAGVNISSMTNHGVMTATGTNSGTSTAAMTNGQLLVGQTSTDPLPKTITGDVTITSAGATTLATGSASNLNSGVLAAARGGAGTVSGIMKANGSGTVSAATAGTDYVDKATTSNLTAGFTTTSVSIGTKSTGTFTPDPTVGNIQHYTNGGAHTLAPPSSVCTMILECTNASAGAITTSGFTIVDGDIYSSTGTKKHIFYITKTSSFSRLTVVYVTGT